MNIKLKTLQQKEFQVEVESADSIKTVKEKVEKSQGFPATTQKLIFSGIKIKESDFIVVMTTKPKAVAKPKPEAATPATSAQPQAQVAAPAAQRTGSAAVGNNAEPATPSPPARMLATQATVTGAESAAPASANQAAPGQSEFLSGEQYETAISNMIEMGYSRDQCVKAMRASFNNPDRAVEYLITGIPEAALRMADNAEARNAASQPSAQGSTEGQDQGATRTLAAAGNLFQQAEQQRQAGRGEQQGAQGLQGLRSLEALRDTPQFRQLQQLLRQSPHMLSQVLMQMAQQQPQLMELISQHEEEFLQMLLEGMSEEEMAALTQSSSMSGLDFGSDEDGGEDGQGSQFIQVTQQEKEAIDRLQALGFQRELVIQAYFACDKNEELAANYLFDHGHEDME
ncbi:UV excision repair protein rad23 [Coemansia sp. RSA 1822]|nr:UV excision repair protein rad23 [Coemansia sp. RSA 638]KAJ2564442.1 UV excision repair protein rad23 [Coemansia sp. RSA 1822]